MKNSKRKTGSDKLPLTLHLTGQYCKKIMKKVGIKVSRERMNIFLNVNNHYE